MGNAADCDDSDAAVFPEAPEILLWELETVFDYQGSGTDLLRLTALVETPVPIPPAMWLFGSALGLLG